MWLLDRLSDQLTNCLFSSSLEYVMPNFGISRPSDNHHDASVFHWPATHSAKIDFALQCFFLSQLTYKCHIWGNSFASSLDHWFVATCPCPNDLKSKSYYNLWVSWASLVLWKKSCCHAKFVLYLVIEQKKPIESQSSQLRFMFYTREIRGKLAVLAKNGNGMLNLHLCMSTSAKNDIQFKEQRNIRRPKGGLTKQWGPFDVALNCDLTGIQESLKGLAKIWQMAWKWKW